MAWIPSTVGIVVILLGACLWRFRLVHLLSTVDKSRIIDKEKAVRLTGSYLILLGACFLLFGYYLPDLTDKHIVLTIACFIPLNMIVVVSFMVAQSRNAK